MKSKKIDKLRYEDYEGIEVCHNLFLFLESLNIKSAVDAHAEADSCLEQFCSDCHVHSDNCVCREQLDYDWDDSDRAYDAWKDSQLEEQAKDEV